MSTRSGLGKPDLKINQTFILITKTFLGFGMDVHLEVENNDGSFPDANPPSDSEDDIEDKQIAAETYFNNNDNNMKKIITRAMGLNKENNEVECSRCIQS
jgi:hypothetical protein